MVAGAKSMGFLRSPPYRETQKSPQPSLSVSETLSDKVSTILESCQKRIRFLHGPYGFFNGLLTKARRKDRESSAPCQEEHKLYLEEAVLERKFSDTDLKQLADLPPGLGYNEWLASHTIDFFHHINLLYGTISEFCTMTGCPDMTGPAQRQYLWFDEKGKKTKVAAPQYIDYVMTFTQKTVNDESIFPTKFANEFPNSFESIVKKIERLLFHVLAHMYHIHFKEIVLLNLHSHLNCVFAHFMLFSQLFKLIDEKETEVLNDLAVALRLYPDTDKSKDKDSKDSDSSVSNGGGGPEAPESSSSTNTTTNNTSGSLPDLVEGLNRNHHHHDDANDESISTSRKHNKRKSSTGDTNSLALDTRQPSIVKKEAMPREPSIVKKEGCIVVPPTLIAAGDGPQH